jgi:hypothetical protein
MGGGPILLVRRPPLLASGPPLIYTRGLALRVALGGLLEENMPVSVCDELDREHERGLRLAARTGLNVLDG